MIPSKTTLAASRRQFLASSALALGAAAVSPLAIARAAHASGSDEIKIGLIGCGARGSGAAAQALSTAGPIKLWAMADAFEVQLTNSLNALTRGTNGRYDTPKHGGMGAKIDVPPERRFIGLDAYQKLLNSGVDVVIMAQPPGFRPEHFEAAVKAGKHVFMEKPLATDAPGVRRVAATGEEAKRKGLKVGVGLQRRHEPKYNDTVRRIHEEAIGKLLCLRVYWDGGPPAKQPHPRGGMSELEYQIRNWYFFTWLGGDHIVEQHIHNIDVGNWLMNGHPVQAQGMGGRQVRTGKEWGQIYDHHFVEFTYDNDVKMFSQCRQIPGCWPNQTEHALGTNGSADVSKGLIRVAGQASEPPRARGKGRQTPSASPYQTEHDALFDAIRNDKPYSEVEPGVLATMTAIMGRMATYSGKVVTWDEAYNSQLALVPAHVARDTPPPVTADEDGFYPVAMPGVTEAF
jgi:myo-inositol 2-dehydrogenase / D-chiro-inositol 1-dehydrogenase